MKTQLVLQIKIFFVSLILAGIFGSSAFAHFVWIESSPLVQTGKEETVRFYFGEFNEFLREEAGGRLDDLEGLDVWMDGSDGKKQAVKLEKKTNFFQALVKPEKPGRCNIVANDLKTEVKDGTKSDSIGIMYKPMFYARTQFLSFEAGRVPEKEAEITDILDLDIIPITSHLDPVNGTISPDVGDEVVFQVLFKGQPLEKANPFAYSPIGWVKGLRTNSKGITHFTPLWAGTYVIDCVYLEKVSGQFNGKKYEGIRHRATLTINVRTHD